MGILSSGSMQAAFQQAVRKAVPFRYRCPAGDPGTARVSAGFASLHRPEKTNLTFDCTPTYLVPTKVTISHIFCREEQGWLRR